MRVKDCMCSEVVQATPETNLNEVAKLMFKNHVGCLPICKDEKIVGFVTDRDIVVRAVADNKDCNNTKVSDIMITNVIKTTPDTELGSAIDTMEKNQIRRIPVIENDKVVGMLTISDLVYGLKPAEVGEVIDCICEDSGCNCD